MKSLKFIFDTFIETFKEWNNSPANKYSASLAYYAIFSIPGLLIIIIWTLGYFFGEKAVSGEITEQIGSIMGEDIAESIQNLIASSLVNKENFWMKTVGVGALVFGATTLFFQLQHSLNELWDIEPAPKKALVKFLLDRANSLGMILILGFLLLITMVLSSLVSAFNTFITNQIGFETYNLIEWVNGIVSFVVIILIFAFMFKVLPDVDIEWKSVWVGALITSILFLIGKTLLNYYFANFKPASVFGTAGTVILIMMWINYSCLLVFFGAIFTKIYSIKKGYKIQPSKHAKWSAKKLLSDSASLS